jgi:hypothetical protein
LFNTHLAVDLFTNEDDLKYDLAYKGHNTAWGNIWNSISEVSDISLNTISYSGLYGQDASYGYYLTGNINYEFPPKLLTNTNTIITNAPYGNGEYIVTGTPHNSSAGRYRFSVFRGAGNNTDGYYQSGNLDYVDSTGDGYIAKHITLKVPRPFILKKYLVKTIGTDITRTPTNFRIYGSNNGTTWTLLDSQPSADPATPKETIYTVDNNINSYYYYKYAHANGIQLAVLRYYGELQETSNPNISRQLLSQLVKTAPERLQNLNTYVIDASKGIYSVPLLTGDSISFKLTLQTAPNQHLLVNRPTAVPSRSYQIRINLRDSVIKGSTHADAVNVIVNDTSPLTYNGSVVLNNLNTSYPANY